MSVANVKARDSWTRLTFEERPQPCFFCGGLASDVVVLWSGCARSDTTDALIVLHPDCATKLGIELISDARTAQRALSGKSLLAGVCRSLLAQGEA